MCLTAPACCCLPPWMERHRERERETDRQTCAAVPPLLPASGRCCWCCWREEEENRCCCSARMAWRMRPRLRPVGRVTGSGQPRTCMHVHISRHAHTYIYVVVARSTPHTHQHMHACIVRTSDRPLMPTQQQQLRRPGRPHPAASYRLMDALLLCTVYIYDCVYGALQMDF